MIHKMLMLVAGAMLIAPLAYAEPGPAPDHQAQACTGAHCKKSPGKTHHAADTHHKAEKAGKDKNHKSACKGGKACDAGHKSHH